MAHSPLAVQRAAPLPERVPVVPGFFGAANPRLLHWKGLRVWLIGASTGIGAATARALHDRGATVFVSSRSQTTLDELVRGMANARACPLDATDEREVTRAARMIAAEGPLDLVLYCAGHYKPMRAVSMDLEEMRRHLDVNYIGALNVCSAVVPQLLTQGHGHLSLVSSVAGFHGLPNGLAYGPTKAALTHLAETLHLDLSEHGLGVSVIHPGFVQTPLTAGNDFTMPALITPEAAAEAMIEGWAAGRFDIHFPRRFTLWVKMLRLLPYRVSFPLIHRATGL